ncbi:MAG: response regulator transcription factor [Tetrasphaera sp.]
MGLRVVAVDDHPIVVEGIMSLVARTAPDIELVASATSWEQLREAIAALPQPPDLALVDLHLRTDEESLEAIHELTGAGTPVVVLTSELRPVPIRKAIAAGASGLALKSDPADQIVTTLRDVGGREYAVSSDLAFVLMTDPSLAAELAPREIEVLSLLADGVPRKSIGSTMQPPISLSTVNTYLNRACARYRELGRHVWSPRDVVRAAIADGHLEHIPRG